MDHLNIPKGDIQETPDFGSQTETGFIGGMAQAGETLGAPVDIDKMVNGAAAVTAIH